MSTMEEILNQRDILYKIGLLETMCFQLTTNKGWWTVMNDVLLCLCWHDVSCCRFMIERWPF